MGPVNVLDLRSGASEALAPGPWGYLSSGADVRNRLEIPPEAMPANFEGVADSVGDRTEVLLDGGIPRDRVEWRTRTP